ncbi:hypothetical protein KPH14_003400 [Odynerus spinipes]|uniref:ATPase AAA-type core domain-containing protein n=1 Tax=Odynerus spinipes TaxID=1348599 RepID=A0AAD9RCL4_9HYME|nr:hypothetical protein KPH14_003400 [Odynerus spinipes]
MSHDYYTELWLVARSDMEKLLQFDRALQRAKRIKGREDALSRSLSLYIKYRNLVKRLVICYNQMIQTQKRELIKQVVDCAIGRMLEYKREVVKLDCSYFQWPDDVLYQLKLTPDDVATPSLVVRKDTLVERREYIEEIKQFKKKPPMIRERSLSQVMIASMTDLEDRPSRTQLTRRRRQRAGETSQASIFVETPEQKAAREAREAREAAIKAMHDAILLIQSHERARVGRTIGTQGNFNNFIKLKKRIIKERTFYSSDPIAQMVYEYKRKLEAGEMEPQAKLEKFAYIRAIVMMQRAWRRYAARKELRNRIDRLEDKLDMTIPSWKPRDIQKRDEEIFQRRLEIMPSYAAQTEKAVHDERIRLLKMVGPGLIEDITDEIHEWFIVWYDTMGHFDVYPRAELGGSVLIVTGQTIDPEEYLMQQVAAKKADRRGGKAMAASAAQAAKQKPKGEERRHGWYMPETPVFNCLETANNDFIENWSYRDESSNPLQKPYLDLITDKLCYELQLETRQIVDELLRLELDKLNEALLKDHAFDRTKYQIPKMPGAGKPPKKKKKRAKKDRLAGIPVDDLFRELVEADIIRNYPERSLNDWFGDLSYQNFEAYNEYRDHFHRLGEIKQIIMEYCILPISSKQLHTVAPLTRSVCICGLPRYGKNFLVDAICTEVGALLFDMTPSVLVGKYTGKKSERRLMEIIGKISRLYAPSIVFIDGGEKPWVKKVLAEERYLKPKRFARHHTKFVKSIKRGDQVLFLTVSSEPYNAKGAFLKIHNVFIVIPLTDYNTLYMYYKDLLMRYHGIDRNINVSCLAKMSVGVPLEFIREAIERVLSLERRIVLKSQPLSQLEIMEEVWKYEPLDNKTLQKYQTFEKRTPLGRRRERLVVREKKEQEKQAALKAMLAKRK